jgi:predicted NBD/HSP70 family sugar kinase
MQRNSVPPTNRERLLDLLRVSGTSSRIDLVEATGLTAGTISNLVRVLVEEGLVEETGRAASRGGQPRRMLQLRADSRCAVGVHFERGGIELVLTDFTGRTIGASRVDSDQRLAPARQLEAVGTRILAMADACGIAPHRVLGIGLVAEGPLDVPSGTLLAKEADARWQGQPIAGLLERQAGFPVRLLPVGTAAALAERVLDGGRRQPFGVIYLASSIAAGVVHEGQVFRGTDARPVELGHITVDFNGPPCPCGNRGCLSQYSSGAALAQRAASLPGLAEALGGGAGNPMADVQAIAEQATRGHPQARALWKEAARGLGHAAVSLVNLFGLETVVLAGPALAGAGDLLLAEVRSIVQASSCHRALSPVHVERSRHGPLSAAIGGALQVLCASDGTRTQEPTHRMMERS